MCLPVALCPHRTASDSVALYRESLARTLLRLDWYCAKYVAKYVAV